MRIVNKATKQAKNPTIFAKKTIASRFRFSMSKYNGSDKNKNPITAADNTNKLNMVIGMMMVPSWLFRIELTNCTMKTIITIYSAAPDAYKNGFFMVLFIVP
jgi:hypothetical protein